MPGILGRIGSYADYSSPITSSHRPTTHRSAEGSLGAGAATSAGGAKSQAQLGSLRGYEEVLIHKRGSLF